MKSQNTKRVKACWSNWKKCISVLCNRRMLAKLNSKFPRQTGVAQPFKNIMEQRLERYWHAIRREGRKIRIAYRKKC